MKTIYELLCNDAIRWSVMAIIIFAITFLFKYPYKKFLTDRIKDEKKRKLANKAIVVFTLALGILLELLWCCWSGFAFTEVEFGLGLRNALSAIAIYSALELKTQGAIDNPFDNKDSQEVITNANQLVTKISKDGKVDEKDLTAVQEFWDKVK